jgi:hypothetical protein
MPPRTRLMTRRRAPSRPWLFAAIVLHHFLLQRAWVVIMCISREVMHDYLEFSFRNETQSQASQALKELK